MMENSYYKPYNKRYLLSGALFPILMTSISTARSSAFASSGNSNREGNSIVGDHIQGYELGKDNGSNNYRADNSHNSKCPPNDSLSWCTGYKIGYEVGWAAAAALVD